MLLAQVADEDIDFALMRLAGIGWVVAFWSSSRKIGRELGACDGEMGGGLLHTQEVIIEKFGFMFSVIMEWPVWSTWI